MKISALQNIIFITLAIVLTGCEEKPPEVAVDPETNDDTSTVTTTRQPAKSSPTSGGVLSKLPTSTETETAAATDTATATGTATATTTTQESTATTSTTSTATSTTTTTVTADTTAPTPGSSGLVTTTSVTALSLTVNWGLASDNKSTQTKLSYRLYKSAAANLTQLASTKANGTPITAWSEHISTASVTSLSPQTAYTFNVIVRDEAGNEAVYQQVTTTTLADTTPPSVNGLLTYSSISMTGMTVNWSASTDDVTPTSSLEYRLYYSTSNNLSTVSAIETNGTAVGSFTAASTSQAITGLSYGTKYYTAVIVKDASGNKAAYPTNSQKTAFFSRAKANGTLVTGGNTTFALMRISADSQRILYTADQETDAVSELYINNYDGSNRIKLSGTLVNGGNVTSGIFAPNSQKVVYHADQDTDGMVELYTVNIDGTNRFKVSGTMVTGGNVTSYTVSPDSTKVAYIADQETDGKIELFVSTLTSGAVNNTKVSGTLVTGGNITSFRWTNDSSKLVFFGDKDIDAVTELYSVSPDGTSLVKLHPNLVAGRIVNSGYILSPDTTKVAYHADQDSDNVFELYISNISGSSNTKVSGTMVMNGDVYNHIQALRFTTDSTRVIYIADQTTDNDNELYSVKTDGTDLVKISGTLVTGGEVMGVCTVRSSANDVIFIADRSTDNVYELYTAKVDGTGSVIKLSGSMVAGGEVKDFVPDSTCKLSSTSQSKVAFLADRATDEVFEMWSVNLDGTELTKLSGTMVTSGDVTYGSAHVITEDGTRLVYRADQDVNDFEELYSVNLDGTNRVKINQTPVALGYVPGFSVSPDSRFVVYSGNMENSSFVELWTAGIE